MSLGWLELREALDEFFCAASGKTHGDAAVLFIAFHADNSANSVARMANLAAKHGICIGAAFYGWPAKRTGRSGGFGSRH